MEIRALFERNWRYILFAVLTVGILWALYAWRMTLLPFMVGLLMAYLFWPIVKFIERVLPGKGKWSPHKAVWAVLLAIVVQLLENNLIVPKIMGNCLRLHPSLILLLLVLGGSFWGFWGLVLTVPITATLVDIFSYVRSINRETSARTPTAPATK